MRPTVGRIVHYQTYNTPSGEHPSVPRAAVITESKFNGGEDVMDERNYDVMVCVLDPTGIFFNKVPYSMKPTPGCWNWPPRDP